MLVPNMAGNHILRLDPTLTGDIREIYGWILRMVGFRLLKTDLNEIDIVDAEQYRPDNFRRRYTAY
jgi:hypothetical protein